MNHDAVPSSSAPDDLHVEAIDLLVKSSDEIARHSIKGRRHSTVVRVLRLALPVLAIGVVVVLWNWSEPQAPLAPVPREQISPQSVQSNELVNPKFQSEDARSRPYTITADKATQNTENKDVVVLQNPVADMTLSPENWVALSAQQGEYAQSSGKLHLNGQVEVRHNGGYELSTQSMDIDVTSQVITTDAPVTGHGPAGEISAQGLDAYGAEDKVIFQGPAKLILRTKKEISRENP
ncbi:MAG: LPS export ABC transporter periplasmic protein LptC [Pseudobdellovibrionaceae bacterium]